MRLLSLHCLIHRPPCPDLHFRLLQIIFHSCSKFYKCRKSVKINPIPIKFSLLSPLVIVDCIFRPTDPSRREAVRQEVRRGQIP